MTHAVPRAHSWRPVARRRSRVRRRTGRNGSRLAAARHRMRSSGSRRAELPLPRHRRSCSTSAIWRSSRTCWPSASARLWIFPTTTRYFTTSSRFETGRNSISGMYPKGSAKRITFDQPGLSRLFCNIHPNMAAYVMAVDSPYFAVSNENGAFTIAGVPPGTYTYHAWRPGGQPLTGSISVDGDNTSGDPLVGADSRVDRRRARHARRCTGAARRQTIAAELDVTTGYSGEDIRAAALQLRLFGEAPGGIGFFAEAAWGDRWAGRCAGCRRPPVGRRSDGHRRIRRGVPLWRPACG